MIQELNKKFYIEYEDKQITNDSIIISFNKDMILCNINDLISFPKYCQTNKDFEYRYLFQIGETLYFLAENIRVCGYEYINYRMLRGNMPKEYSFAGITAHHIYTWYNDNKYCGRCSKLLIHDKKERMLRCECGNLVFPKISPAVIIGVINDDKIVLSGYKGNNNLTALIAGYNEIGETLEETVVREVKEEIGLVVKNIKYYKSQPWGLSNTILAGYFCYVDGNDVLKVDYNELENAKWVKRDEIELVNDDISLTREMIIYFKEGNI